jgi:GTP diphosphokinase / guanosine-3',5'-bis(diphosphate) 3'-diphosphatase
MFNQTLNSQQDENINNVIDNLWHKLEFHLNYLGLEEISKIKVGFEKMVYAHGSSKRSSGDYSITHPVNVCIYLAELKLDYQTIIGGLLHDITEDTQTTYEDLAKIFDDEILFLIKGVSKLGKYRYYGDEKYAENLRKLFISMSKDLRVIFIKLTDRLHNLKTLKHLEIEKQKKIALESLEIYAPIAERLGISALQGAIEDSAFPFYHKEIYNQFVNDSKTEINRRIKILNRILKKTQKILDDNQLSPIKIYGRAKRYYSLFKKIQDTDLKKIKDMVAIRIIVQSVEECYSILSILNNEFSNSQVQIKDYINLPKQNGYKSLHLIIFSPEFDFPFEFQIRTQEMHDFAEYGLATHFAYKAINRGQDYSYYLKEENLKWISELVNLGKQELNHEEYLENIKMDIFANKIYVLTPNNDPIELVSGATALDFAFKIHAEIGKKATIAMINGKIKKLNHTLQNGDTIEIITDKRQKPNKNWLNWVVSRTAKNQIKFFLKTQV